MKKRKKILKSFYTLLEFSQVNFFQRNKRKNQKEKKKEEKEKFRAEKKPKSQNH